MSDWLILLNIYLQFVLVQDVLKRLRLIDDRVINALNSTLPSESFKEKKNSKEQCKEFCDQVCFVLCKFVAFCYTLPNVITCHVLVYS